MEAIGSRYIVRYEPREVTGGGIIIPASADPEVIQVQLWSVPPDKPGEPDMVAYVSPRALIHLRNDFWSVHEDSLLALE